MREVRYVLATVMAVALLGIAQSLGDVKVDRKSGNRARVSRCSKSRKTAGTLVFVLAVATLSGCPGLKDAYSFYYAPTSGTRVPLVLQSGSIALEFDDELYGTEGSPAATEEEIAALLDSEPLTTGPLYETPVAFTAVALLPEASDEAILELIDRLNADPIVNWANPVVRRRFGFFDAKTIVYDRTAPVFVFRDFVVEYSATLPAEEIEMLNEELGAVGRFRDERDGRVTYYVRVAKGNALSTVDLANIFHEHALTLRAYPIFSPLSFK